MFPPKRLLNVKLLHFLLVNFPNNEEFSKKIISERQEKIIFNIGIHVYHSIFRNNVA